MKGPDVAVIGGGVIGCSIAKHLAERSDLEVCVLEKEYHFAEHQSGRNSGVVHPGFLREPGSLQAALTVEGARRLKEYCREHDIPLDLCGQMIIGRTDADMARLWGLKKQGDANGVETRILENRDEIEAIQPQVNAETVLYCPEAGSVDAQQYTYTLARDAERKGVEFYMGYEVTGVEWTSSGVRVRSEKGDIETSYLVNAAGLYSDRIAHALGVATDYQVVPFRGDYYELAPSKRSSIRTHVYPTPHERVQAVGVHFSPRTDRKVIVGPNIALAFGREAYGRTDFHLPEVLETVRYPGLWRFLGSPQMLRVSIDELEKSFRKERFVADARELISIFDANDFVSSYTGIVAKLMHVDGTLVEDQMFEHNRRSTHVLYVVPGLTSSLAVGEHVADAVLKRF